MTVYTYIIVIPGTYLQHQTDTMDKFYFLLARGLHIFCGIHAGMVVPLTPAKNCKSIKEAYETNYINSLVNEEHIDTLKNTNVWK